MPNPTTAPDAMDAWFSHPSAQPNAPMPQTRGCDLGGERYFRPYNRREVRDMHLMQGDFTHGWRILDANRVLIAQDERRDGRGMKRLYRYPATETRKQSWSIMGDDDRLISCVAWDEAQAIGWFERA